MKIKRHPYGMRQFCLRNFYAHRPDCLGSGDTDGAIDDKLTIHRLGRQISQKGPLIQYLVGMAIEGMAVAMPIYTNPEHPLTKEQIQRLLDSLDALPPRGTLADSYEWERYMALSVLQSIEQSRSLDELHYLTDFSGREPQHSTIEYVLFRAFLASLDWNAAYRRVNELYDALQELPPQEFEAIVEIEIDAGWFRLAQVFTAKGRGSGFANILAALLLPAVTAADAAVQRLECSENMKRLTLATLLYQLEHGELPGENWVEQIKPYLGDNPEQYFSCPSNAAPDGKTTYALVLYGNDVPADTNTFLLVELKTSVPLNEAVVTVDDVLERQRTGSQHIGGMNVAHRSGAVLFLRMSAQAELLRLLGRESETEPDYNEEDNG